MVSRHPSRRRPTFSTSCCCATCRWPRPTAKSGVRVASTLRLSREMQVRRL